MAERYSVEEFIQASKSVEASAGILAVLRGVLHPDMAAYLPEAKQANRVARFVSEFLNDPNRASRAEILEPFQDRLTAAADAIVRLDDEQYPNAHKAAVEFEEKILNMIQIAADYQIGLIANTLGVPCPPFSEDDVVHHWPKVRALIEKYPAVDEQGLRATIARERAIVLRALSTGERVLPADGADGSESKTYGHADLAARIKLAGDTVTRYAKKAGIEGRGVRGKKYSRSEVLAIVDLYISDGGSEAVKAACRELRTELTE